MSTGAATLMLLLQSGSVSQATMHGVVVDAGSGMPLAGAVVSLTELDRASLTGPDGRYRLRFVPVGPAHVTVRRIGYRPRTIHALFSDVGELEVNIALEAGPVQLAPVDVRVSTFAPRAADELTTGFEDRELLIAAVREHPLLAEPDVFHAIGSGEIVRQPEAPSGLHVRGGSTDQTAYLLDGIPVLSPYHSGGMFSAWNPDALARVQVATTVPSPGSPPTLSGTVQASTLSPGPALRWQGATSTTQARLTLDGPLGGIGFLISARAGYPDIIAPRDEPTYLRGTTADWLAKLEMPILGGDLHLLTYQNQNAVSSESTISTDTATGLPAPRNTFSWSGRSSGARWRRGIGDASLRATAWSASSRSAAGWSAFTGPLDLRAERRDVGAIASIECCGEEATTLLGARVERSVTSYLVASDSAAGPDASLGGTTEIATLFVRTVRELPGEWTLDGGAALTTIRRTPYLSPHLQLRWRVRPRVVVITSVARSLQFAQSLRNPESVVGTIYPVDLYLGAGAGAPVARSDQGAVGLELLPTGGVQLRVAAYARRLSGLLLVAPAVGEPFSTGTFDRGTGRASGASVDLTIAAQRYRALFSYGLQRVRLVSGGSVYVPEHGATHLLEGGVTLLPTATTQVRIGATASLGRRATSIANGFEWEACNLLDQGCEFGGSPRYDVQSLGETRLPAYLRVDLGLRHHFHLAIAGRDAEVALFGTYSNLLGRRNVLTYADGATAGQRVGIEMRPQAPLVVGLEWRF